MILISHIINCKYLIAKNVGDSQTIALVTILAKIFLTLDLKHLTFVLLASRLSYFPIWSAIIIKSNLSAVQWCPMAPTSVVKARRSADL